MGTRVGLWGGGGGGGGCWHYFSPYNASFWRISGFFQVRVNPLTPNTCIKEQILLSCPNTFLFWGEVILKILSKICFGWSGEIWCWELLGLKALKPQIDLGIRGKCLCFRSHNKASRWILLGSLWRIWEEGFIQASKLSRDWSQLPVVDAANSTRWKTLKRSLLEAFKTQVIGKTNIVAEKDKQELSSEWSQTRISGIQEAKR